MDDIPSGGVARQRNVEIERMFHCRRTKEALREIMEFSAVKPAGRWLEALTTLFVVIGLLGNGRSGALSFVLKGSESIWTRIRDHDDHDRSLVRNR